jgi:hypothetical protein
MLDPRSRHARGPGLLVGLRGLQRAGGADRNIAGHKPDDERKNLTKVISRLMIRRLIKS